MTNEASLVRCPRIRVRSKVPERCEERLEAEMPSPSEGRACYSFGVFGCRLDSFLENLPTHHSNPGGKFGTFVWGN